MSFDFAKSKNAVAKSNCKKSKIIKKCEIIKISRKIKQQEIKNNQKKTFVHWT